MKTCKKCNLEKDLDQFNKNKTKKDNLDIYCKDCVKENAKKYYNEYIPLIPLDPINNKICITCELEQNKTNFSKKSNSSDGIMSVCKKCHNEKAKKSEWYINQYDRNKKYKRKWELDKYNSDLNFKLKSNIRCRINCMLTKQKVYKNNTTIKYLGCTLDEYKNHIEKQLKPEWNWNNHGKLWEVDHIIPCSSFDFNIEENIFKCFNYKNTQPLCKSENRSKKNKIYDRIE